MGAGLVLAMSAVAGCADTGDIIDLHEPCQNPDIGHVDADGNADFCHLHDPKPPAPECAGHCIPLAPLGGWEGPVLVWVGDPNSVPSCPDSATSLGYTGYADPQPLACSACACDPPTGTCLLPTSVTANSEPCGASGAVHTTFDPPAGWQGQCSTSNTIPAKKMCGGVPCVTSVTIGPLTMMEKGCAVSAPVAIKDAGTESGPWATAAIACQGLVDPSVDHCPDSGEVCAPSAAPPPDFLECIFHDGDIDCPGTYPIKSVFYAGLVDERTCTACGCGAPASSECRGEITLNETADCSPTPYTLTAPISASQSTCYDLQPAMALASKSAIASVYMPGSCEPTGGTPAGSATPVDASTFCCLTAP